MNGQVTDMLSSMSSAPPERAVRISRMADALSSTGSRKGFSSVLQKLREAGGERDRRQDDDASPAKTAYQRSQVKGTKVKDHSQNRIEQSDASMKRAEGRLQARDTKPNKDSAPIRTEERDSSTVQAVESGGSRQDGNQSDDVSSVGGEHAVKDNSADSASGTHTHEFPIWTALMAQQADATAIHQEPAAHEGEGPVSQSGDQTGDSSSTLAAVPSETADSWGLTAQVSKHSLNQDSAVVSPKPQPQQALTTSEGQVEDEARAGLSLPQDAPLGLDAAAAQRTKVNQDAGSTSLEQGARGDSSQTHSTSLGVDDAMAQKTKMSQDTGIIPSRLDLDTAGLASNDLLQKASRLPLESAIKNNQIESLLVGSDHGESGEHPYLFEHHEGGDVTAKPLLPHGHQLTRDMAEQFSERWLTQHHQWSDGGEAWEPQPALIDLQAQHGKLPDMLAAGVFNSVTHQVQPALSAASGTVAQAQPVLSASQLPDQAMPAMMKAVVLNLAQPDLGQVNVRVAMTNDIVHTHLSTDRPEVGQFLLSGQDRLQSSLQMSGFDMGQFRVDIDRQGAGRSFQQGFSQDQQGQSGSQGSPWKDAERATHVYDDAHASMSRRLNVVA